MSLIWFYLIIHFCGGCIYHMNSWQHSGSDFRPSGSKFSPYWMPQMDETWRNQWIKLQWLSLKIGYHRVPNSNGWSSCSRPFGGIPYKYVHHCSSIFRQTQMFAHPFLGTQWVWSIFWDIKGQLEGHTKRPNAKGDDIAITFVSAGITPMFFRNIPQPWLHNNQICGPHLGHLIYHSHAPRGWVQLCRVNISDAATTAGYTTFADWAISLP